MLCVMTIYQDFPEQPLQSPAERQQCAIGLRLHATIELNLRLSTNLRTTLQVEQRQQLQQARLPAQLLQPLQLAVDPTHSPLICLLPR